MTTIQHQLEAVRAQIAQACQRAGRPADSVALLAVSKTFPATAVAEAAQAGQRAFGENYLQEAVDKMADPALAAWPDLVWHCIGPIQSNKTKLVAEHFQWAHTVDRLKIAERLSAQRPAHLPPLNICLQVNMDGGENKSGVAPGEALDLARAIAALPRLCLRGLMSIPEPAPDYAAQYAVHALTQALFAQIRQSGAVDATAFDTLSMGMTADLDAAIAAGSTLVRVGTGIFGGRTYPKA